MRGRPVGALAAAGVVVAVALAALLAAHQPASPVRRVVATGTGSAVPPPVVTPAGNALPWWVLPAVVVVAALAVALLWSVLRDLAPGAPDDRRRVAVDPDDDGGAHAEADLLAASRRALDEAAADLDRGADPREVVVACWVRIEAAAAAAGRGRRPAETSTDVARRWLGSGADRAAVDDLAALYQRARYSTHPTTPDDRDRARAALRAALTGAGR